MLSNSLIIGLLVVILFASLSSTINITESFGYYDNLWPSRDTYCEERGLKKSYMPQKCIKIDECGRAKSWDNMRNCRCVDPKTGFCKICYPRVNAINTNVPISPDI